MTVLKEDFKDLFNQDLVKEITHRDEKKTTQLSQIQNNIEALKEVNKINFFRDLIENNPHLYKNKRIINLNPGMGQFALFLARAGADKVYVFVNNTSLEKLLQKIFKMNNYQNIIEVTSKKIEEVELEPVDVILSDWAGSLLINDPTLKDVLKCREKYLIKNGVIVPDVGKMYIAGVDDREYYLERFNFWKNVYKYKMSIMGDLYFRECCLDMLKNDQIITNGFFLKEINLNTIKEDELKFISSYKISTKFNGELNAIVMWFDLSFTKGHVNRQLSSSPIKNKDNYSNAIFYLKNPVKVNKHNEIKGNVAIQLDENISGRVNMRMSYNFEKFKFSKNQFFTVDN